MTDRNLFRLFMRVLGLWFLTWEGVFRSAVALTESRLSFAVGGLFGIALGLILMKNEWLTVFVYGPERDEENSN